MSVLKGFVLIFSLSQQETFLTIKLTPAKQKHRGFEVNKVHVLPLDHNEWAMCVTLLILQKFDRLSHTEHLTHRSDGG